MKILHTSDWHLGRRLYGRKRYTEFAAFLDWLADLLEQEHVDILLVAGDIFDTGSPGNPAQELYYRFLHRVAGSCCRHIVLIGGNHDSPSFLSAPRELLRVLNVYVVGAVSGDPGDEVLVLRDADNQPEAIICAVPYLRDRDIRQVAAGENIEDKMMKLRQGVQRHYADVAQLAEASQQEEDSNVPIIGMGHLFTAGGRTIDGDGVRELYVGNLAHIDKSGFPACFDYLALGHLHVPQRVGGSEHIRYSGSPLAMGYGEATQDKKVIIVEFQGTSSLIAERVVPCFQALVRVRGDVRQILQKIKELQKQNSRAWLEIEYTGKEIVGSLQDVFADVVADSDLEILRINNRRIMERIIRQEAVDETLDDLTSLDVFERCLDSHDVPDLERLQLIQSYHEIIMSLAEDDVQAEQEISDENS